MKYLHYKGRDYKARIGAYPAAPLAMFVTLCPAEVPDESYERVITVCLGNYQSEGSFVQYGASFIDVNNVPEAVDVLEQTGLAKPYLKYGYPVTMVSGFVEYPVYEFDCEMLKELDPAGFERYTESWKRECLKKQNAM